MVFCLLLIMLTGGMYLLLVAGMRNVQQSQAYQTAQQQAMIGIRAIVNELSNARSDNVYLIYGPTYPGRIAFLSGFQPYPAAQDRMSHTLNADIYGVSVVNWQKWVGFCRAGTELLRFEDVTTHRQGTRCLDCNVASVPFCLNLTFPPGLTTPPTVTPPSGASGGGNWVNKKVVARNISELTFEPGLLPTPVGIIVTLYAEDATASDKATQVRYRVTAWLTN